MTPDYKSLPQGFKPLTAYQAPLEASYKILPFNFTRIDQVRYLVSNDAGDYFVLRREELIDFVNGELSQESEIYRNLRARHFLYDEESDAAIDLLAIKIRTKFAKVRNFTSLHLFVVTLRCDYSCPYCQVSRQTEDEKSFDMSEETALQGIDFVFKSPSPSVKIEFQGGEPLLNFSLVKFIVEKAEERNKSEKRDLEFVIATNLSFIDEGILGFCEEHGIYISTSLDGPAPLHNANRPRRGKDGHKKTLEGIQKVQERLGPDHVSALMTTTRASLDYPRQIIDEYLDAGFRSIFLRPISPYGFALKTRQAEKYNFERFFEFYQEAMDYILDINRHGVDFVEQYSSLVLTKLLSPFPTGYVDLQNPAGIGISAIVFNYDGGVYASDEGRMLAEMGDETFRLGELGEQTYEEIMLNPNLHGALEESITFSSPECSECAFQPFCGSDPVYHHATQGDWVGHKEFSAFCERTKKVTGYLIRKLEDSPEDAEILQSWVKA